VAQAVKAPRQRHIPKDWNLVKYNLIYNGRDYLDFYLGVHFVVKRETIGAHLAILALHSPVMADMFEPKKFKEGSSKTVPIENTEPKVSHEMMFKLDRRERVTKFTACSKVWCL
jgi:BTB/POZ domain